MKHWHPDNTIFIIVMIIFSIVWAYGWVRGMKYILNEGCNKKK